MSKEKLYADIERYLNMELADKEMSDFQQRMKSDDAFAEEVAIHRKLHEAMEDPQKWVLKNSLNDLRQEFANTAPEAAPETTSGKARFSGRFIWIMAGCLLLALVIWFFVSKMSHVDQVPEIIPDNEEIMDNDHQAETTPENEIAPIEEKTENRADESTKQSSADKGKKPVAEKTPDPYGSNTYLLDRIERINPQGTHQFTFNFPEKEEPFSANNGQVVLSFQGKLTSYDYGEKDQFILSVFNNEPENFRQNKPILEIPIQLTKIEGEDEMYAAAAGGVEEFNFKFTKTVTLPLGRYYYVVRLVAQPELLAGGVFLVN